MRIRAESKDPNQDGTADSHYRHSAWVTVSNKRPFSYPEKPTGLSTTAGVGKLDLTWTAPTNTGGSPITGYDVHYKTFAAANQAGTGSDPTTGWVAASHGSTATTGSITGLTPGTAYNVRVRARTAVAPANASEWSDIGSGTPIAASTNANLSRLTASSATGATGTFTALTLTPSTFSAQTTSYTATVANARTHVKLTPTVADTGKATVTVQGSTVASGSESDAIELSEGANALTVRVTAEDTTTTKDYTVTITRQAAPQATPAPTGLTVTPGDTELTARWTAPSGVDVSRYEAQIKLKSATSWPGTDTDVTGTSYTFTSLVNGSPYQVRVRTVPAGGDDASVWSAPAEGTPRAALSSNANLSGLTATSATSASGAFTALPLTPAFSAQTTGYAATVAYARRHVRLTPTVADTGKATVTVQGTTVASGSASDAIGLSEGANALTVRVTAEDSTTTKDYTVTVTREQAPAGTPTAGTPTVSLSASPNPVAEGSPVTVTARLSEALSSAVTIPLTVTDGSAEPEDHGTLASITVAPTETSGTGEIATNQDTDTADERFTVTLGSLPASVSAGNPNSVTIMITDDDRTTPGPDPDPNGAPTVMASCEPCSVGYGGEVQLTADAEDPDGDSLTYRWTAPKGTLTDAAKATVRWRAPNEMGRVAIRVRVSDGSASASAVVHVDMDPTAVPALPLGGAVLLGLLLAGAGLRRGRTAQ